MATNVDDKFTIRSQEDGTSFTGTFADGPPLVVEGYAGWQVVNRPKDLGIVEWQGRNPIAIEIPFIIDFWMSGIINPGVHCEAQVHALEKLCGLGQSYQPPVCRVYSQGVIPHDYTRSPGLVWVIENLTWDRDLELRNPTTGNRLRCGGTLQIRQFRVAQDIFRRIGPSTRASKPRIYIVKKGDTLSKIAKRFYHNPHKWKIIADANNMRDRRSLHVGKRLKIPRL